MRADFQQFYGLNLDEMGGAYSIGHAACLAAQLPYGSRVVTLIVAASEKDKEGTTQGESHSIYELNEILAKPRKEVQHG